MSPRPISSTEHSLQARRPQSFLLSLAQAQDLHGGKCPASPAFSNIVPLKCPPPSGQGKLLFPLHPFLCGDPQDSPWPLQGNPSLAPSGSIRPEMQLGPGLAPGAELGEVGGEYIPLQNKLPPPRVLSPLGNKTAEAGRPGGQGQVAWARDAGPFCPCRRHHPPLPSTPPATSGAEPGSKFSPHDSRLDSYQGSPALSVPFLRVRAHGGCYTPKGAGIGQILGFP